MMSSLDIGPIQPPVQWIIGDSILKSTAAKALSSSELKHGGAVLSLPYTSTGIVFK
jgi:hypothetical protein